MKDQEFDATELSVLTDLLNIRLINSNMHALQPGGSRPPPHSKFGDDLTRFT